MSDSVCGVSCVNIVPVWCEFKSKLHMPDFAWFSDPCMWELVTNLITLSLHVRRCSSQLATALCQESDGAAFAAVRWVSEHTVTLAQSNSVQCAADGTAASTSSESRQTCPR